MKKILCVLCLMIICIVFTSCNDKNYSVIVPNGTPLLGISEYVVNNKDNVIITKGSQELVSAWNSKSCDVIIMPITQAAKLYGISPNYVLYKTFVWGNLSLVSKEKLSSLNDINNKKIIVFGKNSTPDIIMKTLIDYYNLNVEIEYVQDVQTANTLLISNDSLIIVSAEPSLSKLKTKFDLNIIDLQDEWSKISNNSSYPQAGIFVKKSLIDVTNFKKEVLEPLESAITLNISSPINAASQAILADNSFETLGYDTLIQAIPNCHFDISKTKKEEIQAIEYYFNTIINLGLGEQIGGKLPSEEFYN